MFDIAETRFFLLLWLTDSAAALVGLATICAALARHHWFQRAATVGGLLFSLSIVPAFDLVLIFLAEAAVVGVPLIGWRVWRACKVDEVTSSQSRWHFSLADLLLLTAAVATLALLARNMPEATREWLVPYLAFGAAFGCAVLAGYFSINSRGGWATRGALMACASLVSAIMPAEVIDFSAKQSRFPPFFHYWGTWPNWLCYPLLVVVASLVASWLWLGRAALLDQRLFRPAERLLACNSSPKHSRTIMARVALVALSAAIIALPTVAYYQMLFPTRLAVVPAASANAYVELQRLGEALASSGPHSVFEVYSTSRTDLEKFLLRNQTSLKTVRSVLACESIVPLRYTPHGRDTAGLEAFRALQRALLAEARLAELDGRFDDACDAYSALVALGVKASRGGVLRDWFLGTELMRSALRGFEGLRDKRLSSIEVAKVCAELESLGAIIEPIAEIAARDEVWKQYTEGWPARIRFLQPYEPTTHDQWTNRRYWQAELRFHEVELAVRAFMHKHGVLPERLTDLMPDFFSAVPSDPYTGENVTYRGRSDRYLLSVAVHTVIVTVNGRVLMERRLW